MNTRGGRGTSLQSTHPGSTRSSAVAIETAIRPRGAASIPVKRSAPRTPRGLLLISESSRALEEVGGVVVGGVVEDVFEEGFQRGADQASGAEACFGHERFSVDGERGEEERRVLLELFRGAVFECVERDQLRVARTTREPVGALERAGLGVLFGADAA